jgi:hypothetical protein
VLKEEIEVHKLVVALVEVVKSIIQAAVVEITEKDLKDY